MIKRMRVRPAESGLSLIFAMLALLALGFGAVALVRAVDTGILTIGNLTAKQTGVSATGQAAEKAMEWLETKRASGPTSLDAHIPADGYYAVAVENLDPTARSVSATTKPALIAWDDAECKIDGELPEMSICLTPKDAGKVGKESVQYIITRMCSELGAENDACLRPPFDAEAKSGGCRDSECAQAGEVTVASTSAYFRIIVRSKNARGSVAFTETLVHY